MTHPTFLIIRLSAIGDIVMASGLISALKQQYPNCKISWLAEPVGASLLQEDERLEQVIVFNKPQLTRLIEQKQYWAALCSLKDFVKQLRSTNYDYVLETQGLLKSAFWAKLAKCKQSVGFKSKEKSHYFVKKAISKPRSEHISSEYIHLAKYFSCLSSAFKLALLTNDATKIAARDILLNKRIKSNYICIAPFTTRPQKHWIFSHWQSLLKQLTKHTQMPIVIMGGQENKHEANMLADGLANVVSLCGYTNLLQASETIAKSRLLIGVDTGLTHMGIMHNTPTIAIFGSTRPYTLTPNKHAHVIYQQMQCAPCKRRPTCNGAYTCMQELMPTQVFSIATKYIDNEKASTNLLAPKNGCTNK